MNLESLVGHIVELFAPAVGTGNVLVTDVNDDSIGFAHQREIGMMYDRTILKTVVGRVRKSSVIGYIDYGEFKPDANQTPSD